MSGGRARNAVAHQPAAAVRELARALMLLVPMLFAPATLTLAAEVTVRTDSPERYTVVEGDTLWDISARFLEEPWLWPEVWQINPQIANPDLIYPGDVVELAYVDGVPVLRFAGSAANTPELRTVRLSPTVRRESLLSPVPAISLEQISGFLSGNSVVGADEYENSPYVLGEADGHTLATVGDEIYARGQWVAGVVEYEIVRNGRVLDDPDTGRSLGIEAIKIGTATLTRSNTDRAILTVTTVLQEVRIGDRLIPAQRSELEAGYLPRPPANAIDAAIVSIGDGNGVGGQYDTLVLNVGRSAGIESGHLLTIREPDVRINDAFARPGVWTRLKQAIGVDDSDVAVYPGDNVGSVLIYRVFDNASLGLVLSSSQPLRINDRVVTP
jgi:hypothetical protein